MDLPGKNRPPVGPALFIRGDACDGGAGRRSINNVRKW